MPTKPRAPVTNTLILLFWAGARGWQLKRASRVVHYAIDLAGTVVPVSNSEQDPLEEAIRDAIYTAVGIGLLVFNRVQAARREVSVQLADDIRGAWADLAAQVPEDVLHVLGDLSAQLPGALQKLLRDLVDQAPVIADVLREFVYSKDNQ